MLRQNPNPLNDLLYRRLRENLRRYRGEARYSQQEVACRLGISRSAYTYYETGKTVPTVVDLFRLAGLYRIRLEDFLAPLPGE